MCIVFIRFLISINRLNMFVGFDINKNKNESAVRFKRCSISTAALFGPPGTNFDGIFF